MAVFNVGVVRTLFVKVSEPASVASVPVVGSVRLVVADVVRVRLCYAAVVRFPESGKVPDATPTDAPPPVTTRAFPSFPLKAGNFPNAVSSLANSARMAADSPADPVLGKPV